VQAPLGVSFGWPQSKVQQRLGPAQDARAGAWNAWPWAAALEALRTRLPDR